MKFGLRLIALGLGLAVAPVSSGHRWGLVTDVLPSMVLLGFGAGLALDPVLLAAIGDVEPTEAGLAWPSVNTAFVMRRAARSAWPSLAAVAALRTTHLEASGEGHAAALTGTHLAFLISTIFRGSPPYREGRCSAPPRYGRRTASLRP